LSLSKAVAECFSAEGDLATQIDGFRPRVGQLALAERIGRAIENRSTLVAEAGTGTGKTFAYLVPALLSGGRVMISTGTKTLQDQLFDRDLPAVMKALDVRPDVALLKGRANYICLYFLKKNLDEGRFERREDAAVLRRIQSYTHLSAEGDRGKVPSVDEMSPAWAYATSSAESCLGSDCPDYSKCYVVRARQLAAKADVVVVNHHLLCADMALRDGGVAELLPSVDTIIFDEAHQLPDVATQFFGQSVSSRQMVELARDSLRVGLTEAKDAAPWSLLVEKLVQRVRELRLAAGYPRRIDVQQVPSELDDALSAMLLALRDLSAVLTGAIDRGKEIGHVAMRAARLIDQVDSWKRATQVSSRPSESSLQTAAEETSPHAVWVDVSAAGVTFQRLPLSVSKPLREHRTCRPQSWIMLSATLTIAQKFDHFIEQVGADDAEVMQCESPFDYPTQALLYLPKGLGNPNAPGYALKLLDVIWPLIRANGGRAFVLCTSLRMVAELAQSMGPLIERQQGFSLVVQGTAPRAELLERFRKATSPVLIGSASFWEGVDVVGSQLSLVVIDKLPFAPPDDPLLKARSEALERAGGNPFSQLQIPAAALALKQGAGRLIRSETDRGMLVLADERLVTKGYGKTLLASLPPYKRTNTLEDALAFLQQA
jgi:ATP-dependent DNA helicase DinG